MPFGSIFSKFPSINLTTAEGIKINFKNNLLSKIALKIIGFPYIGLRLRAKKILNNLPKGNIKMLDAGFGTGIYSFSLANKVSAINAIDNSKEKVDYAKKINIFNNIKFERGDLKKLRFKNESFDLIICSEVLEHIKDDEKAFSELARVLAKNGTLLITVPFDSKKNKLSYKKYGHERVGYTKKDINDFCRKYKLTLIKSEGYSRNTTEKVSIIVDKIFMNNKIAMSLLFYPVYLISKIVDKLCKKSEPNGVFFNIKKTNN